MHLHKADVVAAATALLDRYGIADLTMRRLARELDVSPGALYWHFANKQQLLGAVADRILTPASHPPPAGSWRESIETTSTRLRDALQSHTDGAELVSASFAAGASQAMLRIQDTLRAAAIGAGVDAEQADLAARTLIYYILGFTADMQSRLQWNAAGAAVAESSAIPASDGFQFGLGLLIDGIAVRRSTTRPIASVKAQRVMPHPPVGDLGEVSSPR